MSPSPSLPYSPTGILGLPDVIVPSSTQTLSPTLEEIQTLSPLARPLVLTLEEIQTLSPHTRGDPDP